MLSPLVNILVKIRFVKHQSIFTKPQLLVASLNFASNKINLKQRFAFWRIFVLLFGDFSFGFLAVFRFACWRIYNHYRPLSISISCR